MFSTAQTFVVLKELAKLGAVRSVFFLSRRPLGNNSLAVSNFPYAREDPSSLGGRAVVSRNGCPCLYFPVILFPSYIRCGSSLDPGRRHEGILQVTTLLLFSAWLIRSTCKVHNHELSDGTIYGTPSAS